MTTIHATVGTFAPAIQTLIGATHTFRLQISGMYSQSPAVVGRRFTTLVENFFGSKLNVVYQYRVGDEYVFAITVNRWNSLEHY